MRLHHWASWNCTGELFFGFVEENANKAGTIGGRFINATLTAGQTIIVPQGGSAQLPASHCNVTFHVCHFDMLH